MILFKCLLQGRDLSGNMDNTLFFVKSEMIILVITNFHCLKGIPVICMFKSQH